MQAIADLGPSLGFAAACEAVGLPKATYYRRLKLPAPRAPRACHRALDADERRGDAPRRGPIPLLRTHDVPRPG